MGSAADVPAVVLLCRDLEAIEALAEPALERVEALARAKSVALEA
jgi:hypothetical protein